MKKAIIAALMLGLCLGLATAAMAATDSDTVTVTVSAIEALDVPAATAIALQYLDGYDSSKYDTGTVVDYIGYSHNSATAKKITATAAADSGNTPNDITLKVAIGTQTAGTIVNAGTDVSGGAVVWTGIAAGGYTQNLTWTADGTLAGTLAGSYVWTVTFTSTDAQ